MIVRLALRAFASNPARTAVLSAGFGFGIAVMAALLGVGQVVLEQARSPALQGGGDLLVTGAAGRVESARFQLASVLGRPPLAGRLRAASPYAGSSLYLVDGGGPLAVSARGGVPSLERAVGDPETAAVEGWRDEPADRAWTDPDPAEVLRAMDRFHAVPETKVGAGSWAEWLYFNGASADGSVRFYLTFLAGPPERNGARPLAVRLQLDREGAASDFRARGEVAARRLLEHAPDLEVAGCAVRLDGTSYRIRLDLASEGGAAGPRRIRGEIVLGAPPGRSVPPFELRGAGGWVSCYTVPVLAGPLSGELLLDGTSLPLGGGTGYHDHNWGFWEGVTWQWGQVSHDGLSFLYGRVLPPAEAADPARAPAFLAVVGPEGPLAFARGATIQEEEAPGGRRPAAIRVRSSGPGLVARLDIRVADAVLTRLEGGLAGSSARPLEFLQMRGVFGVEARVAGRDFSFEAPGAAETFREGEPRPEGAR